MSKLRFKAKRGLRKMFPKHASNFRKLVRHGLTQSEARSWLDYEPPYPRTILRHNEKRDDNTQLISNSNEQGFLAKHSKPIAQVILCVVLTSLLLIAAGLYLVTKPTNTTVTSYAMTASNNPACIVLPNVLPEGSTITLSQPTGDTMVAILSIDSWKILRETGTLTKSNILKQSTMPFRAQSPVFTFNAANSNQYVACVLTNSSTPIATANTFTACVYPERALGNVMWLTGGGMILAVRGTLGLAGVRRVVDFYHHKVWKKPSSVT